MNVKASAVAAELRKLAESLEQEPEAVIVQPHVFLTCGADKDRFLRIASLLPHPLKKEYEDTGRSYDDLNLKYETSALYICASVYRSVICTLVEPAKPAVYNCEPLLSLEEEATLEA